MAGILEKFSRGEGTERDITVLQQLADVMTGSSLCGLGQAAPNPVVDSLQYFKEAFESRIRETKGN